MKAANLKQGDRLRMHFGQYLVRVVDEPVIGVDRFGQRVIRFTGEIVVGPDRVGERGGVALGPDAEVTAA